MEHAEAQSQEVRPAKPKMKRAELFPSWIDWEGRKGIFSAIENSNQ